MEETKEIPALEARVNVCRPPAACGSAQVLAFAELVIGRAFVIRDIRILRVVKEGAESVFAAFPSRRSNGGERKYYDVAFPITSESYRAAASAILEAFEEASAKA
jgi:DNA-binding cell septation regulator SpoVG